MYVDSEKYGPQLSSDNDSKLQSGVKLCVNMGLTSCLSFGM